MRNTGHRGGREVAAKSRKRPRGCNNNNTKKKKKREERRVKGVRISEGLEGDAHHCQARLGALPRPSSSSSSSSTTSSSPLDDLAPLRLRREKGNGRRIYCWVLTCTHSWCCFSPLGPSAIPKASKTTGCQVVTAGFKQLLQQPCTLVPKPRHGAVRARARADMYVRVCVCVSGWLSVCLVCACGCMAACVEICVYRLEISRTSVAET